MSDPHRIPILNPSTFRQVMMSYYDPFPFGKKYFDDFFIHPLSQPIYKLRLPLPPHRKTVADMMLLTAGTMTKSSGLTTYEVMPNSLFRLPAGQITETSAVAANIQGYYLHFSSDYLLLQDMDFGTWLARPVVKASPAEMGRLLHLLQRLESLYNENAAIGLIKTYLYVFLAEVEHLAGATTRSPVSAAGKLVQAYLKLLAAHSTTQHAVGFYAGQLSITPNHLTKATRTVLGRPASALLHEMLVLEAKIRLSERPLTMSEVAFAVGFDDPAYFGRFFRQHTGLTPSAYRQKIDLSG